MAGGRSTTWFLRMRHRRNRLAREVEEKEEEHALRTEKESVLTTERPPLPWDGLPESDAVTLWQSADATMRFAPDRCVDRTGR